MRTEQERRPWRLGPQAVQWFDAALVVGLLGLTAVTFLVGQPLHVTALSALQVAPLAWRRSRPATTFALVWLFSGVQALVYDYPAIGQLAYPVALYSLARFGRPRDARAGLALSLVATGVAAWVWVMAGRYDDPPPGVVQPDLTLMTFLPYTLTIGAIVIASWALGTQARIRRAYEQALMERGERMAEEAEQRTRAAAAEERTRVAREMHDVVAHGITGMIVQADGARYAAQHDPEVAVRTLETVASTGREALTEMRRLLGLLRGTSDPELVPQPGLDDLPRLLAADVAAGRVRSTLPDPAPAVPDGVALTVFRVVQESLTNVRKHAGADATATVDVRLDGPDVLVDVVDDGHGAAHPAGSGGLGLVGMRERVAVHGGTLDVGPAPGGGWRVRARIPR
ncbi:sensor histidine kinase [Aeromicrobium sp. CnD17-E]|uniref:sensor histidine kinase n=1 Tax=Aeromicrobium sp. CnD17-E TaxID=2954487 RepID=UPI0020976110|nr:sensor histidine kinase [Aeromicrobium sp. CnD17-E]MCO7240381.1 sensor histidine kinase [Aeromicrobium sp. CnD17-E]